jgi:hypothetical protein
VAFFLAFGIEFPFIPARGPHADDAHALGAQPREHDDNDATDIDADRDPTLAGIVRRDDQGGLKERFVQVGEIQPVLVEIGEAFRFVPRSS